MASAGTSSPSAAETFLCLTRAPVRESSWLKCTVLRETAAYSLIGMLTSPNEMDPLQMARGMAKVFPPSRVLTTRSLDESSVGGPSGELVAAAELELPEDGGHMGLDRLHRQI